MKHEDILHVITEAGLSPLAFSGNCFTVALALKRQLIVDGTIVVAVNEAILNANKRFVGHAGVLYDGIIYDGEGVKDWDDFEAWGALDPDDPEWAEQAQLSLAKWSRVALKAAVYEVSEDELIYGYVKMDLLGEMEGMIAAARKRLNLSKVDKKR